MRRHNESASAVSVFTAVGILIAMAVGLVGLVLNWIPLYIGLLWCGLLGVALVANVLAGFGSRS